MTKKVICSLSRENYENVNTAEIEETNRRHLTTFSKCAEYIRNDEMIVNDIHERMQLTL